MAVVSWICDDCIAKANVKKVIRISTKSKDIHGEPCSNCQKPLTRMCVWRHNCTNKEHKEGYCPMMDQLIDQYDTSTLKKGDKVFLHPDYDLFKVGAMATEGEVVRFTRTGNVVVNRIHMVPERQKIIVPLMDVCCPTKGIEFGREI